MAQQASKLARSCNHNTGDGEQAFGKELGLLRFVSLTLPWSLQPFETPRVSMASKVAVTMDIKES